METTSLNKLEFEETSDGKLLVLPMRYLQNAISLTSARSHDTDSEPVALFCFFFHLNSLPQV